MTSPLISPGHTAAQSEDKLKGCSGYQLGVLVQAMILAFSWIIPSSGSGDGGASLVAHGDGLVRHGALPAVTVMVPRPGALPRATTARVA